MERDGDQHLPGGTAAPSTSALEALPPMVSQRLSPSLAERLSRLSVRSPVTGGMRASCSGALSPAQALGPAAPSAHRDAASLAACTGGVLERGGFITLRTCIPLPLRFGRVQVDRSSLHPAHLHALGLAAANAASDVLFIDTETTGLSGGTGTLPFLIGAARIDGRALAITQWLLADFAAEAALLDVFGNAVRRSAAIATYNGKSFDVPLLRTRLVLWRRPDIFEGIPHADLLHWSRRMAPQRSCPDFRLTSVETHWLGLERVDDVGGSAAPEAWRRWMCDGDPHGVNALVQHNRHDLIGLFALSACVGRWRAGLFAGPAPSTPSRSPPRPGSVRHPPQWPLSRSPVQSTA